VSLFGGRKRDGVSEESSEPTTVGAPGPLPVVTPTPPPSWAPTEERSQKPVPARAAGGEDMANIGKSIVIKGDLTGDEDLVIEGRVEGKIHLPNNRLTIGAGGNVKADVHAKSVVVVGHVAGNVSAGERIEVQASGVVDGDVRSPRLSVQEGAVLNGSIEMSSAVKEKDKDHPAARPVGLPQPPASSSIASAAGGEARRAI